MVYRIEANSWQVWNEAGRTWIPMSCGLVYMPFREGDERDYQGPNTHQMSCGTEVTEQEYRFSLKANTVKYISGQVLQNANGVRSIVINRMNGSAADRLYQGVHWPSTAQQQDSSIDVAGKCEKSPDPATLPPPEKPKPIM